MDDFNINSLQESRNEWTSRLVTILLPCIFNGLKSIFDEAVSLTANENQPDKYLMTFQNLLIQIPKWNNQLINNEVERIINQSQCNYIEDLITCVHIIQLKALTCVRVGQNEKNVDINIPKLSDFIHRTYINTARSIYSNIYLFEQNILPLQIQQNYNKVDTIIKESIIESIRQSMPIDEILRSYLEDTVIENVSKNTSKEFNSENNTIDNSEPVSQTSNPEPSIIVEAEKNLFDVSSTLDNTSSNIDDKSLDLPVNEVKNDDNLNLNSEAILDENTQHNVRFSDLDDEDYSTNESIKILDETPNINMNIEDLTDISDMGEDDPSKLLGVEVLA